MRPNKETLENIRKAAKELEKVERAEGPHMHATICLRPEVANELLAEIDALEKERDELKARKCSHGPYEMYGTDGCEKCDYGRIEMYRLNRLCLECQHKDDVQAARKCGLCIDGKPCNMEGCLNELT